MKYTKTYDNFINKDVINFDEIKEIFLKVYSKITSQPFNNNIIILKEDDLYKKIRKSSTAAMKRKIIFGKNKIWIRKMPDYQILYELSHEIGHTLKPNLENYYLSAEEIKATLFQYCFVHEFKKLNIDVPNFEIFVNWRINWIMEHDEKYAQYHKIAKSIAEYVNYNFDEGVKYILKDI